jgi:hypothetical protein
MSTLPSSSLLLSLSPRRRAASALILARTFWSRIAWRVGETSGEREVSESWVASSEETCVFGVGACVRGLGRGAYLDWNRVVEYLLGVLF